MENGTPLIRLEGVQKVFFTEEMETHALADIHLEILDGEFAEVMGPSGCGKSTLLSLIGLLDTPTDGDYWLDGEPVANLTASERARVRNKHIGFMPLLPPMGSRQSLPPFPKEGSSVPVINGRSHPNCLRVIADSQRRHPKILQY